MENLLIATAFSLAFFAQSIFGFGGVLIAFALLGPFVDIKTLVFLGLILSFFSKLIIFLTGLSTFSFKKTLRILLILTPGVFLGAHFLAIFPAGIIVKIFAVFLALYSVYSLFVQEIKINTITQYILFFLGGLVQGMLGTGGPFVVIGGKDYCTNKSEMRTMIAFIFLLSDIIRGTQYHLQGTFNYQTAIDYWWMILLVILSSYLGYHVHLNINEKAFKKGILILLLLAGIVLFFK